MPVDIRSVTGPTELIVSPGSLDQPLHVRGRVGSARLVALAVEEEQQRVPAELEHVAVVALGDPDQALEDAREQQHELLRARPALRLQPLRERGEAGEVDRDQRPFELSRA